MKWLCTSPKLTSYRVNTLKNNIAETSQKIQNYISEASCIMYEYYRFTNINVI